MIPCRYEGREHKEVLMQPVKAGEPSPLIHMLATSSPEKGLEWQESYLKAIRGIKKVVWTVLQVLMPHFVQKAAQKAAQHAAFNNIAEMDPEDFHKQLGILCEGEGIYALTCGGEVLNGEREVIATAPLFNLEESMKGTETLQGQKASDEEIQASTETPPSEQTKKRQAIIKHLKTLYEHMKEVKQSELAHVEGKDLTHYRLTCSLGKDCLSPPPTGACLQQKAKKLTENQERISKVSISLEELEKKLTEKTLALDSLTNPHKTQKKKTEQTRQRVDRPEGQKGTEEVTEEQQEQKVEVAKKALQEEISDIKQKIKNQKKNKAVLETQKKSLEQSNPTEFAKAAGGPQRVSLGTSRFTPQMQKFDQKLKATKLCLEVYESPFGRYAVTEEEWRTHQYAHLFPRPSEQ